MSASVMARACTGWYEPLIGIAVGPSGTSREVRLALCMPPWVSSMPASAPCSWIFSAIRATAGMSRSSHRRSSMEGVRSAVWWISVSSVHTTAQPPSAFTPRMNASAVGSR